MDPPVPLAEPPGSLTHALADVLLLECDRSGGADYPVVCRAWWRSTPAARDARWSDPTGR